MSDEEIPDDDDDDDDEDQVINPFRLWVSTRRGIAARVFMAHDDGAGRFKMKGPGREGGGRELLRTVAAVGVRRRCFSRG